MPFTPLPHVDKVPMVPIGGAVRHANYAGDVTHMVGEVVGPNTFGEFLGAVEAQHDPEADTTRVGFAYLAPASAVQP